MKGIFLSMAAMGVMGFVKGVFLPSHKEHNHNVSTAVIGLLFAIVGIAGLATIRE